VNWLPDACKLQPYRPDKSGMIKDVSYAIGLRESAPASSTTPSPPTASTNCSAAMPWHSFSRLVPMRSALDHDADIAKVQEWLGHANIATTRIYDRRKMKPEDLPTFKVKC
jgi:hypothetical protein